MTRIGRRLIEDFLLPALNDQRYGDLLKWIDRDKFYFSIRWSHKNAAKWTLADTAVFQDWDRLKGHYHPEIKGYYMQAKQRFRAALYKLNSVRKVPSDDKHVKIYQLIPDCERRKPEFLARSKFRIPKTEDNRKYIPTSVICKHTSYTGKEESAYSSPSSPASSTKSDTSDKDELQKCLFEYSLAQRNHMMLSNQDSVDVVPSIPCVKEDSGSCDVVPPFQCGREGSPPKGICVSSNLKENSLGLKAPHIPIQPAPVYSSFATALDSHQKRFESPKILLVKTYNELEDASKVQDESLDVQCVVIDPDIMNHEPDALNLSLKSDSSESLSR